MRRLEKRKKLCSVGVVGGNGCVLGVGVGVPHFPIYVRPLLFYVLVSDFHFSLFTFLFSFLSFKGTNLFKFNIFL